MPNAFPPLNALRAFEAAARHANFARAAEELNVTPGALSHQIRGLEALLGVTLFERQARGVALTEEGRTLHPGLVSGFAQIRAAVQALKARAGGGAIVVSVPPGFTSKWLAPRLYRFAEAHPEIELRIAASTAYANFARDGVHLALRSLPLDAPADPALDREKLVDDVLMAVCSPKLLRRGARAEPERLPLIHDEQLAGRPEVPTWADWFRAAGRPAPDLRRGLRFSSAEHAIDAALQGAGLLLAHGILVHDELAAGRLVMPLPLQLPAGRAYFLVRPKARGGRPVAGAELFLQWLQAEMAPARKALAGAL